MSGTLGEKPHDEPAAIPNLDVLLIHELLSLRRGFIVGLCREFDRSLNPVVLTDEIGSVVRR